MGVVTDPQRLEPTDFAITIAMNSRATAGRMHAFMKQQESIEEILGRIPQDVRLASDTLTTVFSDVAELFSQACQAKGTKLAVASKVLHRKRPLLIPMLDSVLVDNHYWLTLSGLAAPSWFDTTWLKNGPWSDPTHYMRVMADELDANRDALAELRQRLVDDVPNTISDVRLLEATLYAHLSGMVPASA